MLIFYLTLLEKKISTKKIKIDIMNSSSLIHFEKISEI